MRYSPERKEAVLRKMLPPHNRSIPELAEEEGISEGTLYNWRRACEQANDWDRQQADRLRAERKADRERLKALERELKKKEKALAETAALLARIIHECLYGG